MRLSQTPVPRLTTIQSGPLYHLEEVILKQVAKIEAWFRQAWQNTAAPITSSVDLRHAGFKLAPVDTNLFPAGFNNLNKDFIPLCVQAVQSILLDHHPGCTKILILPESHTRNIYYLQSLNVLQDIFSKAGFVVKIGSLDDSLQTPLKVETEQGASIVLNPLIRKENSLEIENFKPCLILLNNDLSSGTPAILEHLNQPILPPIQMGWRSRLKSTHFHYFEKVAEEFGKLIGIDPWLINPLHDAVQNVDFMAQEGLNELALKTDHLLNKIQAKYDEYQIKEQPFVAIKADNGTYGMSVMMVRSGQELLNLNRKQRTKMDASKGSQKVTKVIIQEGIYTFETMPDGAVAEPVVYMIGPYVVGGFYRVHRGRGKTDNLNAPGMRFEPLAFAKSCNIPSEHLDAVDPSNRFYVYGVISRLAALAAGLEMDALENKI